MKKNKPKNQVKKTYKKYNITKGEKEKRDKIYIEKSIIRNQIKRELHRDKDNWIEIKGNRYIKEENKIRSVFGEGMKVEKTKGSKREGKKHCSSKSQWKYNREELEKEGKVKPEITEVKEEYDKKIYGIDRNREKTLEEMKRKEYEEVILLISEKSLGIYIGKVKKYSDDPFITTVWKKENKRKRVKCLLEKWDMREDPEKIIKTPVGERSINEIIKISISTNVGIYKIIRIIED